MRRVKIMGVKSQPLKRSGWKESDFGNYDWTGREEHVFTMISTVREGNEERVVPRGRINCGADKHPHRIKNGSLVFDMGPKSNGIGNIFLCEAHYNNLPTLELLISKFKVNRGFPEVVIIDAVDNEILFQKKGGE